MTEASRTVVRARSRPRRASRPQRSPSRREHPSLLRRMPPPNSSPASSLGSSPHGCPGPDTRQRTRRPAAPAQPARQASRSPGPLPSLQRTPFPGRPRPGIARATKRTHWMHARLGGAPQARPRRQRGPSVAVRGKPPVTPTARQAQTPSAIRPWTPQHHGPQRDKATHHRTEKKQPASARIRSYRAVSAGGGRCWVRPT